MTRETQPIIPTIENPQPPTVTITQQELDYLKHGAHQFIESIGRENTSGVNFKEKVGFKPPRERFNSSDSKSQS